MSNSKDAKTPAVRLQQDLNPSHFGRPTIEAYWTSVFYGALSNMDDSNVHVPA